MKVISLVTTITLLIVSYLHDAQAASLEYRSPTIYVFNSPGASSDGEYTRAMANYNNAPVYEKDHYSLYRRQTGFWVLDANEISEEDSGSISYSLDKTNEFPWQARWQPRNDTVVLITNTLYVHAPYYTSLTIGKYETDGTLNKGSPVYIRRSGGSTFFVYRRSNGQWYHTFQNTLPDSGGALAYGYEDVSQPWESTYYPDIIVVPLLGCGATV